MSEKWIDRVRESLENSAGSLPASDLSRLNRARQRALQEGASRSGRGWPMAAALAFVLALGLGAGLWLQQPAPVSKPVPMETATPLADLDLLTADEDLEMLADLEFYLWLEKNWAEDAG